MRLSVLLPVFAIAGLLAAVLWMANRVEDGPPVGAGKTILLLTPDTLRHDYVRGLGGKHTPAGVETPHLDRLARGAIRFRNAWSPVPLTLPAHLSMLTALPPAATGVRVNASAPLPSEASRGFPMVQEPLARAGWHTAAFVSAGVLSRRYRLDQGFSHYDDGNLDDLTSLTVPERTGTATVLATLAHVNSLDRRANVFLWVHLFDPHRPYLSPRGYAGDIASMDSAVGELLSGLASQGRENVLVVMAADHGESLGALGEESHGMLLGGEVLRIPMFIAGTDRAATDRDDLVGAQDVAPTIAALAGIPWASSDVPGYGIDLLSARRARGDGLPLESLFAHSRYRWAQLSGVATTDGLLVDRGLGRQVWIDAPAFAPSTLASEIPSSVDPAALRTLLGAYRRVDRGGRAIHATASSGYGGAALVTPFLSPRKNAELLNPYEHMKTAKALDALAAAIQGTPRTVAVPERVLDELAEICENDPNNAEAHFWHAEALRRHATTSGNARASAHSEAAYLRSWSLGRRAPATLLMACLVNGVGREAEMLKRLELLAPELPAPDCQVELLRARFLKALGRDDDARKACAKARRLCTTSRQRAQVQRTCR